MDVKLINVKMYLVMIIISVLLIHAILILVLVYMKQELVRKVKNAIQIPEIVEP